MKRILISFLGVLLAAASVQGQTGAATSLKFGVPPSLLDDLSPGKKKFFTDEFPQIVKDVTGMEGTIIREKNLAEVAHKVTEGTDPFAILQGIEFAWVSEKSPGLKPLLMVVNRTPDLHGILLVKKDSKYAQPSDLKGQSLSLLKQGRLHVELYVQKIAGGKIDPFFGKVKAADNAESALDAVLLGNAECAAVDDAGLDTYKEINPGRFNRLRILGTSEPFPPGVLAYDPKKVDAKIVERVRAGMLRADQLDRSRDAMNSFGISKFEAPPADLPSRLDNIRKAYPNANE